MCCIPISTVEDTDSVGFLGREIAEELDEADFIVNLG